MKPQPKRTLTLRKPLIGFEYLTEETQVLYQILNTYFLTPKWRSLSSVDVELCFLLTLRNVPHLDQKDLHRLIIRGLSELEESGYIGFYVRLDPHQIYFRQARGKIQSRGHKLPDSRELVKKLVERFSFKPFVVNQMAMLTLGQILRDVGIDWESRAQLNRLLEALYRMQLLDKEPNSEGYPVLKLSEKVRKIFYEEIAPRRLSNHPNKR